MAVWHAGPRSCCGGRGRRKGRVLDGAVSCRVTNRPALRINAVTDRSGAIKVELMGKDGRGLDACDRLGGDLFWKTVTGTAKKIPRSGRTSRCSSTSLWIHAKLYGCSGTKNECSRALASLLQCPVLARSRVAQRLGRRKIRLYRHAALMRTSSIRPLNGPSPSPFAAISVAHRLEDLREVELSPNVLGGRQRMVTSDERQLRLAMTPTGNRVGRQAGPVAGIPRWQSGNRGAQSRC